MRWSVWSVLGFVVTLGALCLLDEELSSDI